MGEEDFELVAQEDEGVELRYDEKCDELLGNINRQIRNIKTKGFEPQFILVNKKNYERLISYTHHKVGESGLVDFMFGCNVVIWDVPTDYVNVRCKASEEWAYEGSLSTN